MLPFGFPNGFNKSLWLQMNIAPWLIAHSIALLMLCTACFKGFMVYYYYSGLICSIHHVTMQLNDVIKISISIGHF